MKRGERTVALVAPHFAPSNLAGVHRARLLAQHLHEFGWRPIVVTTHWRHYEEPLDWGLNSLVDPALEIVRTRALPTRPLRLVGDIGVRAMPWHLAALRRLRRENRVDFLHITVPSFYSACLGQLLYADAPLPFGIDYIDPWVHVWPEAKVVYSKAWVSMKLAQRLEPLAVRNATLITGVSSGYYAGVLDRNPHLADKCVTAAMPYGFSALDFQHPAVAKTQPYAYSADDGNIHLVYAGALLPRAHDVMKRLFEGVAILRQTNCALADRLRLHFIGTGKSPTNAEGYNVLPIAARVGVEAAVSEHPHRMAYLDVLAHLSKAFGVLIVGSTEPHYTPSKVYQAVQSRRPVLALLHEASTAVGVLERSGAGRAMTLSEDRLPSPDEVAAVLKTFIASNPYRVEAVRWREFDAFSSRESSRLMARALDAAMDNYEACRPDSKKVI
jgi:hypothetical protein